MNDRERTMLQLLYDLHVEHLHFQSQQLDGLTRTMTGLREAVDGATAAIHALQRSHQTVVTLMKQATADVMGVNGHEEASA
jgi:hypothetical protein